MSTTSSCSPSDAGDKKSNRYFVNNANTRKIHVHVLTAQLRAFGRHVAFRTFSPAAASADIQAEENALVSAKLREAEDALLWLQGAVFDAEAGDTDRCGDTYRLARPRIDAAEDNLRDLGLWKDVENAFVESLALINDRKYLDAQKLLASIGRQLREASGSNDELRKKYGLQKEPD